MSCDAVMAEPSNAQDAGTQTVWPSHINLNRQSRTLELVWSDMQATISHRVLRKSCRCSVCESTRRKLNDVLPVDADVELLKIEVLGSIGVQLFFSDAHDRGIYPWAYLRQIAHGPVETGFTESLMKGWRDE
jgi:DUF971 family protein